MDVERRTPGPCAGTGATYYRVQARLVELLADHEDLLARMDEVPGINTIGAQQVLSEVGTDLENFANAGALCAWAGVEPPNNESAERNGVSGIRCEQANSGLTL